MLPKMATFPRPIAALRARAKAPKTKPSNVTSRHVAAILPISMPNPPSRDPATTPAKVANPTVMAQTTIAHAFSITTLERLIGLARRRPMVRRSSSPAKARAPTAIVTTIRAIGAIRPKVSIW